MLITIAILVLVAMFAAFHILNEVRVYRNGGDVFEWTKKIDKYIPRNWRL